VYEAAVGAHRENFAIEFLEFAVPGGDRRQFGRSNEGEITGVETDDNPLALIGRELHRLESLTGDKRIRLEIGRWLSNERAHSLHLLHESIRGSSFGSLRRRYRPGGGFHTALLHLSHSNLPPGDSSLVDEIPHLRMVIAEILPAAPGRRKEILVTGARRSAPGTGDPATRESESARKSLLDAALHPMFLQVHIDSGRGARGRVFFYRGSEFGRAGSALS
jgi:hypothetical protein